MTETELPWSEKKEEAAPEVAAIQTAPVEVMTSEVAGPSEKKTGESVRTEWPKKYKNWTHGPLALDVPTYGTISLGGKATVWLWHADFANPSVQKALKNKTLIAWDDKASQPVQPVAPPPVPKLRSRIKARPGHVRARNGQVVEATQSLAEVLTESRNSAPLPQRDPKVFTHESMVPPGGSKPTVARKKK